MTRPPNIATFLWMSANGQEAAEFYVSLLPDSRIVDVEDFGGVTKVISFELGGHPYVIMEHPTEHMLNESFSIAARVDGQAEVDRLWDALMEGGQSMACGWLRDRFGICWQITPMQMDDLRKAGTPAQAQAVFEAMMHMIKFDVAALEAAFEAAGETA
ncbi:MAG: VOC family protein [Hyphomonas sp.]|nr:VOC family protein [Hyphomonas sp.]